MPYEEEKQKRKERHGSILTGGTSGLDVRLIFKSTVNENLRQIRVIITDKCSAEQIASYSVP